MKNSFTARLTALFLTAVLLLNLTGCAFTNALTAYGLYSNAAKKLKKAGGCEVDCAITMSFDILDGLSQTINANFKQNGEDSRITTGVLGQTTTITHMGDFIYAESGDEKIKYRYNKEDAQKAKSEAFNADEFTKLPKSIFENIDITSLEDGKKAITLTLDKETFAQFSKSIMGSSENEAISFNDVEFDNIVLVMTFAKNKDIETMNVSCDANMNIGGMSLGTKIAIDYTFVNFGTAPEILLGYPESEYEDGGEYFQDESGIF